MWPRTTPDALLLHDLGEDSLRRVELVMSLEDEFRIDIPDENERRRDAITMSRAYAIALQRTTVSFYQAAVGSIEAPIL